MVGREPPPLGGLRGLVVEVGCGDGPSFARYPRGVAEVVAVEPDEVLRGRARERAESAAVPVRVVRGRIEALPCPDAAFDAGVATRVPCSEEERDRALAELHRVIRPGGELRWRGRRLKRAFPRAVERAGFDVVAPGIARRT